MSKFRIVRKDLNLDPLIVETDGLTIGRLLGNDLTLNHPTVSRTQAGIKEIEGDYWLFNLSEANGTLVNGEQIDRTPLVDGDLIQIGPFFLYPKYKEGQLTLEVEMAVRPLPVEAAGDAESAGNLTRMLNQPPDAGGGTVKLDLNLLAQLQRDKTTPQGTRRLAGTGLLTGKLKLPDEQALKIFWDKRKREAGKMATDSPLTPRLRSGLGKAQFNWRPTLDLQRAWPKAVFAWGAIVVTVLAVGAVFAFKDAYSPGALSAPHARRNLVMTPAVANAANAAACTTCHSVRASMNQNCAACHTTSAFHSEVSDKHMKVGLSCTACHSEHHGREFSPGLVANTACVGCHSDGSGYVSPLSGQRLDTPHGGTVGYPVIGGAWKWGGISQAEWTRKGLPGATSQYTSVQQFHLIHLAGRQQGRSHCTDCHTAGFAGEALRQGVRESCAACHSGEPVQMAKATAQAIFANEARETVLPSNGGGPLCVSCHAQHGEEKEARASLRQLGRAQR